MEAPGEPEGFSSRPILPFVTALIHEVERTTDLEPRLDMAPWVAESGYDRAMIHLPGAGGTGLSIKVIDRPEEQLTDVANRVQDAVVEALADDGRPTNWPPCPDHPRTHPLQAAAVGREAVWSCPTTGRPMARVGELGEAR